MSKLFFTFIGLIPFLIKQKILKLHTCKVIFINKLMEEGVCVD